MAEQYARGIWGKFAPGEQPFGVGNGMEDNLRWIDDHLGLYTLQPPVSPATPEPVNPHPGDGQIFTDGTYSVFNAHEWRTYPPRKGLRATLAAGTESWQNTGTGWEYFSVIDTGPASARAEAAADRAASSEQVSAAAGAVYASAAAGVNPAGSPPGVSPGSYFWVPSSADGQLLQLYRNVGGSPVDQNLAYPAAALTLLTRDRTGWTELRTRFVRDGWIDTHGAFRPDDTWGSTPLLRITELTVSDFKLWGHPDVSTVSWWDAGQVFLGGTSASYNGEFITQAAVPDPPPGATFVAYTHWRTQQALEFWKAAVPDARPAAIELAKFPRQGYYHPGGRFEIDRNWVTTDLIALEDLVVRDLCLYGHPAAASIAFFGADQQFISGVSGAFIGAMLEVFPSPPPAAKFVTFTANFQGTERLTSQRLVTVVRPPTREHLRAEFARYCTNPGYIKKSDGDDSEADNNWRRSGFIECAPGDVWDVSMTGHPLVASVAFYDSTHGKIAVVGADDASPPGSQLVTSAVAPAGTAFVRFCHGNPASLEAANGQLQLAYGTFDAVEAVVKLRRQVQEVSARAATGIYVSPRRLVLAPTDKVQLYGDSISSTDYPWYKSALEDLTGAQVFNDGFSGFSAMALAVDAQLDRIWNRGAKVVIAMIGGNDTGAAGSVGTFDGSVPGEPVVGEAPLEDNFGSGSPYFIQAVAHIMRRFRARYDNIRARAGLTGSETESEKTAKIDAVLKPILAFATPLPQKRYDDSNPFSRPENWERKRRAVIECCARYKVTCIDLCALVGWDMAAEPFWTPPTDIVTNHGINTMEGLHPNKWGYRTMAEIDCAVLGIVRP